MGSVPALTFPQLAGRVPEGNLPSWSRALGELARAEAAMAEFGARTRGTAGSFEEQCALDEALSDLVVLFNRAIERLLRVPAPDLAALALKVALAVDEQAWELPDGEACMARLKADAARLSLGTGSFETRPFDRLRTAPQDERSG